MAGVPLLAACGPGLVGAAAQTAATPTASAASRDPGFGGGVVPQSGDGSLQGVWSQLPRSPLSDRYDANVAWTGRYLFVWGGDTGARKDVLRGDGAAWDVTTGRWRALPRSPLTARTDSVVVWTGREVIVWGGYDQANARGLHVTSDGAAWNPATNTWTRLPPSPLRARAGTIATWTGQRMVLLGGHPAIQTYSYTDGATFDPATGTWRKLGDAKSPDGRTVEWRAAVMTDHDLLAWSIWSTRTRVYDDPNAAPGAEEYRGAGGGEMYRYDPDTDRWSLVPNTQESVGDVEQALWTGHEVMVRGYGFWCGCPGPFQPQITRIYRPATGTWTEVPADPLETAHQVSAWAGGLFSYSGSGSVSAWNPTTDTWRRLPSAPNYCGGGQQKPAFLGNRVVYWCPHAGAGAAAKHDGLAYTLTPAAPTGRGTG
jgi:hypothetical protein